MAKKAADPSCPDLTFENIHRELGRKCVGVDEVGRGCLAGPVVSAAVILPEQLYSAKLPKKRPRFSLKESIDESGEWWLYLNDSKLLSAPARQRLSEIILKQARVEIAWCLSKEIDELNILRASMVAMVRALQPLKAAAQTVLVDGNMSPFHPRYYGLGLVPFKSVETLVGGDRRSMSIAAASIVAKVYRDRWMTELDQVYPGYAFIDHKGYPTPAHYAALKQKGACFIHRMSFGPLRSVPCTALADGKQIELLDSSTWQ